MILNVFKMRKLYYKKKKDLLKFGKYINNKKTNY